MGSSLDPVVAKAVGGEKDALTTLLQRVGPTVRGGLAGQIPVRFQALLSQDDVMQQTYTDAFLSIGELTNRTEGSFAAWLTTIARRNLLDALRMLQAPTRGGDRHQVVGKADDESFLALYEILGGTTTTPSRAAARVEAREAIVRVIGSLPETYRAVIQMYDIDNRPVEDVAAAIGRSAGAVFMLRARALRCLGELLGTASAFLSG